MLEIVDLPEHTGVKRDKMGRPYIIPLDKDGNPDHGAKPKTYTRMTTFVDCLEDKENLAKWGKRMVLYGAGRDASVLQDVASKDPEEPDDKRWLDKRVDRVLDISGANAKREKGTQLHALSEIVDNGDALPLDLDGQDVEDLTAYLFETLPMDVLHTERLTVLDEFKVAGTPDRISQYEGPGPLEDESGNRLPISGTFITDLKTGRIDYGAMKIAAQLAGYSRSCFYDVETGEREPLPDVNQEWGLVMNLRPGSGVCTMHWVDLTLGWEAVELAAHIRKTRTRMTNKKVMRDFVHTAPAAVVDIAPSRLALAVPGV